jgi:hypothetical protein
VDPAVGDRVDRHRVEVVQLLPAVPDGGDEVGPLQHREVLADRLPGHVEARAQLVQPLPVPGVEAVEEPPTAGVGQRLEDLVHPRPVVHAAIRLPLR